VREVRSQKLKVKIGGVFASYLGFLLFAFACYAFYLLLSPISTIAQSSDQNFPTHVTSNEISGVIKPRNIGDARLTTYFYLFEGTQGDIFINVATTNFSGDIDVYAADSLKPLTKMVMYADAGSSETGRLIYLRQPARMLLRIEGRTPNDEVATFRIKFAGSFVALAPETYEPPPTVAKREPMKSEPPASVGGQLDKQESSPTKTEEAKTEEPEKTEDPKPKTDDDTVFENKSAKVTVKPVKAPPIKRPARSAKAVRPKAQKPKPEPPPDPLANVRLVILFKDGTLVERPMTEVSRFSFNSGTLTVIEKTGKITRYKMTDISKVTVE
jgi:hypothetical protein